MKEEKTPSETAGAGSSAPRDGGRKTTLGDILLVLSLLLISGAVLVAVFLTRREGAYIEVMLDGELVGTYALAEDTEVSINGGTNVLVIENGEAYLTYANCPDRTCINTGRISYRGQSIVCLPNRVTVTVVSEAGTGNDVDFVS